METSSLLRGLEKDPVIKRDEKVLVSNNSANQFNFVSAKLYIPAIEGEVLGEGEHCKLYALTQTLNFLLYRRCGKYFFGDTVETPDCPGTYLVE